MYTYLPLEQRRGLLIALEDRGSVSHEAKGSHAYCPVSIIKKMSLPEAKVKHADCILYKIQVP